MKYQVTITEILSRKISVEAPTAEIAEEQIRGLYRDEEIVLDYSDLSFFDAYTDVSEKNSANSDFTILQGDCMERLMEIEDNSVDVIFADPPYFLSNGGISVHNGKQVCVDKGEWDKSFHGRTLLSGGFITAA